MNVAFLAPARQELDDAFNGWLWPWRIRTVNPVIGLTG